MPRRAELDPRTYQIAVLLALTLGSGHPGAGSAPLWWIVLGALATVATQWLLGRLVYGERRFDARSALITALSLGLLLRTSNVLWHVSLCASAIAGKFTLRLGGRHVFNPSNLTLVAAMATGVAWVSPGRWGTGLTFAAVLACAGAWVVTRAGRADLTLAFLASWTALLLTRAIWLGDPLALPLHQLRSGALVLFAFFMLSDPKTTPSRRSARILYGVFVALLAGFIELRLFEPHGFLWALAVASPCVPLLDRLTTPVVGLPPDRPTGGSRAEIHHDYPSRPRARPDAWIGVLRFLCRPGRRAPVQQQLPSGPGAT
jgi:Na+-transporting NADH:ubiquinone oxidoreductase subunit NqrB